MVIIGVGLGLAMQPLVLAVQNAVDRRDLGAGTSTSTFSRSLGGALGVAALGALLTNRLTAELPGFGNQGGPSINEPSAILALPAPVREMIQHGFVNALHPVFLVSAIASLVAVLLCLGLPDRELPPTPTGPAADSAEADELQAKAESAIV
jgi:hypothetical protein